MDPEFDIGTIRSALRSVGELLAAEGERIPVVVVGGAAMNLHGLVERTTSDVDVIAQADRDDDSFRLKEAEPFPEALNRAIATVARDLELPEDWMNAMIGQQWQQGFPPSMGKEIEWTNYGGGLDVGLVGRRTLIALKLYAGASDYADWGSVHFQDLLALEPTDAELNEAKEWVFTQDLADGWPDVVDQVVEHVRRNR